MCAEATALLAATPLKTFALPAIAILALISEVFSAPKDSVKSPNGNSSTQDEPLQVDGQVAQDGNRMQALKAPESESVATLPDRRDRAQQLQQQDLLLLERRQNKLKEGFRRRALSWNEVGGWPLTLLEFQRLLLRIVQLKVGVMTRQTTITDLIWELSPLVVAGFRASCRCLR